jgi:hypothetical protein
MSVLMAQAKIKAESVTDVQAATKTMFAAIKCSAARRDPLRVGSPARRRDVRGASAGRRRCGESDPRPPGIPGAPGTRRGLACRADQRSAAEGHRLVPVVLRARAESPCADRHRAEAHGDAHARDLPGPIGDDRSGSVTAKRFERRGRTRHAPRSRPSTPPRAPGRGCWTTRTRAHLRHAGARASCRDPRFRSLTGLIRYQTDALRA